MEERKSREEIEKEEKEYLEDLVNTGEEYFGEYVGVEVIRKVIEDLVWVKAWRLNHLMHEARLRLMSLGYSIPRSNGYRLWRVGSRKVDSGIYKIRSRKENN